MSNGPRFSVVIPTYNRAHLIVRTLETVLSQTYPAAEIIVVDNCSTDETVEVLEPFVRSERIKLIRHPENYERARSRNTGMEAATGDFVTFLDSDDLMYPNSLRDAAAFTRKNPQIRFFHCFYELVDPEGRVLHRYRFPRAADRIRAIAEGNFLSCIGNFISREIYQSYRFDTDRRLTGSEDWDFWLRVVADHELGQISNINAAIVDHAGRTMRKQDLATLRARVEFLIHKVMADPHLRVIYGHHHSLMRANACLLVASTANSNGAYGSALRLAVRALVESPRIILSYRFARVCQIALFRTHHVPRFFADLRLKNGSP